MSQAIPQINTMMIAMESTTAEQRKCAALTRRSYTVMSTYDLVHRNKIATAYIG